MKVAILGLGYVGFPLMTLCAKKGHEVIAIDTNVPFVKAIEKNTPVPHTVFTVKLTSNITKNLSVASEVSINSNPEVIIVCVPTPIDEKKHPDLTALKAACKSASKLLTCSTKQQLVIIESTVYPGTLEEVVKPILEESELKAGTDFFLAHCPERIDPGNKKWGLENIPRVVGALTSEGAHQTKKFYNSILNGGTEVTILTSVKAAEAVKVTENTFRDINIAFVNELAMSMDKLDIDVTEVIRGAATKPFGYMPFYPGPGVGGHCIAVDPYYLIEKAQEKGFSHEFLKLARKINDSMSDYVMEKLRSCLGDSKLKQETPVVALLGLAYKPGVPDKRESPAEKILASLQASNITHIVYDPLAEISGSNNFKTLNETLENANIIILATHHKEFLDALDAETLEKAGIKAVVDARNVLDKDSMLAKGIIYKGIGR